MGKLKKIAKFLDPLQRIKLLQGYTEIVVEETLENVKKYQGKIWFVEDDGMDIGFMTAVIWEQSRRNKLHIGNHKLGEVINIYLEEKYRNKGIGSKMLKTMENYFKEKGCDSMWVEVFSPNLHAHNAYKKFGFIDREIGMLKKI